MLSRRREYEISLSVETDCCGQLLVPRILSRIFHTVDAEYDITFPSLSTVYFEVGLKGMKKMGL